MMPSGNTPVVLTNSGLFVAITSIKVSVEGVMRVASFITFCILNTSKICSKFLVLVGKSEKEEHSFTRSKLQFKSPSRTILSVFIQAFSIMSCKLVKKFGE